VIADAGVSVVIATRGRPTLLRRAIQSIFAQDSSVQVEVVVVFDQVEIDPLVDIEQNPARTVVTVLNTGRPGLAGARNTGVRSATFDYIAFCDDDDEWMSDKIDRQLKLAAHDPDAVIIATGIRIVSPGGIHDRPSPPRSELSNLLESRITELHPSSFLMRRDRLLGDLGLVDESIPASYGEDYDLLLRAAKVGHIAAVPDPLTIIHWDRTSFFSERWRGVADGLIYLLAKHPEFASSPRGQARIEGQIAFAHAALGERRVARSWVKKALRSDRTQLRAYLAWLIAVRALPAGAIVTLLNRRGRGL